MICALLPAAGRSLRMGQPKLLLPVQGQPLLARTVAAFRQAGIARILVVAPPQPVQIAAVAQQAGAEVLHLPVSTPDMRSTVHAGLEWIERHWQPQPHDAWFLSPADYPCLEPEAIRTLADCGISQQASIVVPTYQGRRGHPVLLAWSHVAALERFDRNLGLDAYIRQQPDVRELPVPTAGILADLDTPEDYRRLTASEPPPP